MTISWPWTAIAFNNRLLEEFVNILFYCLQQYATTLVMKLQLLVQVRDNDQNQSCSAILFLQLKLVRMIIVLQQLGYYQITSVTL